MRARARLTQLRADQVQHQAGKAQPLVDKVPRRVQAVELRLEAEVVEGQEAAGVHILEAAVVMAADAEDRGAGQEVRVGLEVALAEEARVDRTNGAKEIM